ncbi:MFS transporter [Thelonectria olida]|uniref:MFS transporter n=1 Tax=Thelonectria olida TaxID=1576542 RepID=A0A9P8W341_9HYPO|nr:MFS transporter [Thelonectria olida]
MQAEVASELAAEGALGISGPNDSTSVDPIPPNGGYGWVCTLSVFLVNAHTWGINSSWAVIMAHLSLHSNHINATRHQWALVGGLSISQALIISPVVIPLSRAIGMRMTLVIGSILIFVSLLAASFATQIWHLYLSQGACFGWGMGLTYITASAALPPWFSTRRSLAVGLSTSGAGFGGLVYSLAADSAIEHFDVAWAYRILAICSLAANSTASALIKETGGRAQTETNQLSFKLRDLGRVEVLIVVFWGVATDLGYITLLYSIPSYASSIGLTPTQGSIANAMLNLGLGIGRPFIGYISDALGRINMALAMTALCTILCFGMWVPAPSFGALAAFSLLAGPLCGTFWATITPVLVEIVGLQKMASTFSIICLSLVLPTMFAESAAMQLVASDPDDAKAGSYIKTQIFVGCMFLAGTISLWLLRAWKVFATEREMSLDEELNMKKSRARVSWFTPALLFRSRCV